jgi:Mg2+ and Co2+ transporter CorA
MRKVKYLQIAYDDISQLIDLVESFRDTINSIRDLYMANVSLQMNSHVTTNDNGLRWTIIIIFMTTASLLPAITY